VGEGEEALLGERVQAASKLRDLMPRCLRCASSWASAEKFRKWARQPQKLAPRPREDELAVEPQALAQVPLGREPPGARGRLRTTGGACNIHHRCQQPLHGKEHARNSAAFSCRYRGERCRPHMANGVGPSVAFLPQRGSLPLVHRGVKHQCTVPQGVHGVGFGYLSLGGWADVEGVNPKNVGVPLSRKSA